MKASELRLGNYVSPSFEDIDAIRLSESMFISILNKEPDTEFDFVGIPISENWLSLLGFIKDDYLSTKKIQHYWNGTMNVELENNVITKVFDSNNRSMIHKEIKYVHSFQNFYHALIGSELEISKSKAGRGIKLTDSEWESLDCSDEVKSILKQVEHLESKVHELDNTAMLNYEILRLGLNKVII